MPRSFRIILIAVSLLIVTSFLTAQTPATNDEAQGRARSRVSELKPFEQYVSYWTTEPGWSTELQLRNNLDTGELTVTPALRTAEGTETALPPVTIKSGDIATLDLADALVKNHLATDWRLRFPRT